MGDATAQGENITWLTEVKFVSRFYHIIAVGQAVDGKGQPRATRRIQAVYDIGVPKLDANGLPEVDANGNPVMIVKPGIKYYRNNLTEYGNLGDLGP